MKKSILMLAGIIVLFSLNSCGVNQAIVLNQNQNETQVQLNSNNFRIVDKVRGSAEVTYVLLFGGMNRTRLFENAYANMVNDANLDSGSKAFINIVTEEHLGGVPPIYYKRTVTVSATVIEFTK